MLSEADISTVLERFPGPVLLPASPRKWMAVLLGCLAFFAGGVWMVRNGATGGWLVAGFFGPGTAVALAAVLPGAGGLRLDKSGFEVINFFRSTRTNWRDASGFEPVAVPPSNIEMVGYEDARAGTGRISDLNRSLIGHNAATPDTYGLPADHLAALMRRWRERALGVEDPNGQPIPGEPRKDAAL